MQRKINLLFLFSILFGILMVSALTINLVGDNYIKSIENELISNSKLVIEMINQQDIKNYDAFSERIHEITKARVTIIDEEGNVLGDSIASIDGLENHKFRPEIQKAYAGKIGKSQRYSDTIEEEMYYVALPIEEKKLVVRLALPLDQIEETNLIFLKQILIASILGIVFSLILGFRFLKSMIDPIKELTSMTQSIAQGNYGEKVFIKSDDEIGELANNFNLMSEELEEKILELNERNDETRAILGSMINGIIAINNSKEIMFINESVLNIFNYSMKLEAAKGKSIVEFFRNAQLNSQILALLKKEDGDSFEIKINHLSHDKVLKVYLNSIVSKKNPLRKIGSLIVIQDVTEIRKLENMRKDFVANVSHEIKTPLTSIRGFIETLKEVSAEDMEIRQRFLNIIDLESKRLNGLIDDLLVISEIENSNYKSVNELINVNETIDEIELILLELAKKNKIDLKLSRASEHLEIIGNPRWFKQLLINLIDNAIKYTHEGGEVILIVDYTKDLCIFNIKDTGIGISEEHLERLFERFYRVDKARSRKVGGTGLGLAIVKHAVNNFNGTIDVKSKIGVGTEFTVKIPRNHLTINTDLT
ncbi:MAG TPA: ATP-binding protein [Clostridia bacterium]|nr:ATP-binding protein [Clostridia bacterium]